MNSKDELDPRATLLEKARRILEKRNYHGSCYPLDSLLREIEGSRSLLRHKVWIYKWSGLFLLVAVPIVSAFLSLLIGSGDVSTGSAASMPLPLKAAAPWLGLTLTVMTILNSIFRPGERFRTACLIGIQLDLLVEDLLEHLEEVELTERKLHALVRKLYRQLVPHQKQLIGLFHPDTAGLDTAPTRQVEG